MKRFIFGFILGGIASGVATYFYVKKKDEDYISSEIQKVIDFYKKQETDEVLSKEEQEAIKNHVNKIPDKPIPEDYIKKAKNYQSEEAEDALDEDDEDEFIESPPEDLPDIEIISVEEFGNRHYDEDALMYYTEDDTLCYEQNEQIIEDRLSVVGDISEWAYNGETDSLYVRNNKTSNDYEIIKVIGSYAEITQN